MLDLHRLVKNLSIVKMNEYGGTKHTGVPVKTLKKLLKKAGLKVSGKKATLTRRAKKARLFGGAGGIGAIKGLPAAVLSREQQEQKDKLLKEKAEFESRTAKTIADQAASKAAMANKVAQLKKVDLEEAAKIEIPQGQGTSSRIFGGKNKRSSRA